jgi:hypothetical protein
VVAQVLVDDAGPDVGHLGPLGELVDDEGVELLVVGRRDVKQEVLRELAKPHPDDLTVLAISLIGPRNQVAKLVRHLELLP